MTKKYQTCLQQVSRWIRFIIFTRLIYVTNKNNSGRLLVSVLLWNSNDFTGRRRVIRTYTLNSCTSTRQRRIWIVCLWLWITSRLLRVRSSCRSVCRRWDEGPRSPAKWTPYNVAVVETRHSAEGTAIVCWVSSVFVIINYTSVSLFSWDRKRRHNITFKVDECWSYLSSFRCSKQTEDRIFNFERNYVSFKNAYT